jgi:hypothetical protein
MEKKSYVEPELEKQQQIQDVTGQVASGIIIIT